MDITKQLKIFSMLPEIDALIRQLCLQVQPILNDKLIGVYLGGSVANGSFNNETSDIDCYIITTSSLSKQEVRDIETMHSRLFTEAMPFAKKIEASYVPIIDLNSFNPNNTRPYFNEGNFYQAHYGHNFIIELTLLREKGIAILGPDIKQLIPAISHDSLKLAIRKNLEEYWKVIIEDNAKMSRSDYQIFAVFTMCRTLYSLETGLIASKAEAAEWVMSKYNGDYKTLIQHSIDWNPDEELNLLNETQSFVRYVLQSVSEVP